VGSMFVIISTYSTAVEQVTPVAPAHGDWVSEGYASGRILVSGRREPPNGGVIVARGDDGDDIDEFMAGDPFVQGGVVDYEVYRFGATDFPRRTEAFELFFNAGAP
jgi:uncharacterized protein YciI